MNPDLVLSIVVLVLGAVALIAVWRAGCLRRSTLVEGPKRSTGLHPLDLPIAILLTLVGGGVGVALLTSPLGIDLGQLHLLTTRQHAGAVLVLQTLNWGLPAAYALLRVVAARGGNGLAALGLDLGRPGMQLRVAGVALLVTLPMLMALGFVMQGVSRLLEIETPPIAHGLLLAMQQYDSLSGLIALIVVAVVVAAVLEEIVFRGLMQSSLLAWLGPGWRWTIVLLTAGAFAAIHIGSAMWHALPALFVFGIILGWLYERTGKLWPPILVHAGFNAFNIALVLVFYG